jgi:hypothetical protein
MCIPQVKGILKRIGCSYTKIVECKKPIKNIPNIFLKQEKGHSLGWKCLSRCKARILKVGFLYCWCYNPSVELVTKARGCKLANQEGDLGVTSHVPRSVKSVSE